MDLIEIPDGKCGLSVKKTLCSVKYSPISCLIYFIYYFYVKISRLVILNRTIMLIRFSVENLFSFGERKEFTMIPNKRLRTLHHHKYNENGFEILKLASIYGANGSGKSNFIKSINLFKEFVIGKTSIIEIKETRFKFNEDSKDSKQILAIEFIQDSVPFYYAIEINGTRIATEELYLSGLGVRKDELIFERTTNTDNKTDILFSSEFEKDETVEMFKSVIKDFVNAGEPILKLLSKRDNKFLANTKSAYKWFDETLQIIRPNSKPTPLAHKIDVDKEFKSYAKDLMCSFNLGITDLVSETKEIHEYFGEDNNNELNEIVSDLVENPFHIIGMRSSNGDEFNIVNEKDKIVVKTLRVGHKGKDDKKVLFDIKEESDGTVRLLDFVQAFQRVISSKKVYVIDEIERSIHPLLIKELVQKFSLDENTKGQMIFSTHESNLLDQAIFRLDEIWFTEKNRDGATDLYSLSDFKEHKTIDIQKGYLNGRYGSIPFLGNLQDLNWHDYDTSE